MASDAAIAAVNGSPLPGPRMPRLLQTIGWWSRPNSFVERCRARYGRRFTVRLIGQSPFVVISDPGELREVFQAPADVLHPGEGAYIIGPVVGPNSVILLDEAEHLEQRKLLLPAFHGEKMQRLAGVMAELAEREVDSWPLDQPVALYPRLQRLTLEIILRTVFGLQRGAQLDRLREALTEMLSFADSPISLLPAVQRLLGLFGVGLGQFERRRAQADALIYELIDQRRCEHGAGEDVLSMLLLAHHSDGSPMSAQELRDELMTALVAGHETTASSLAWAVVHLARAPQVMRRLHAELDTGGEDYLIATIHEVLRHRPVIPNAEPRLVKKPFVAGGVAYERGAVLFPSAYLVHHDPDIYPDPYAFRPERFLDKQPGTYTWIPFGGGRRRCLGASFALLEMRIVLAKLLSSRTLEPVGAARALRARRRGITISPPAHSMVILRERSAAPHTRAGREAAAASA